MKTRLLLLLLVTSPFVARTQPDSVTAQLQTLIAEKDGQARVNKLYDYFIPLAESSPALNYEAAQKLLALAQKKEDKAVEAFAFSQIAFQSMTVGNMSKSLEYALKSLRVAEGLDNPSLMALIYNRIGHNYSLEKRRDMYLQGLRFANQSKSNFIKSVLVANLGAAYLSMNNLDSSLFYLLQAQQLSLKTNTRNNYKATIYYRTGMLYGKLGDPALATTYFSMALKQAATDKLPRVISSTYRAEAEYWKDQNQPDSCQKYAKKAIEAVMNSTFSTESPNTIAAANLLTDIYRNKNNDSAMKYADIYRVANDSLNSLKKIQQSQLMTFEEDLRQKEMAADKLKAEQERSQNIQYALMALGIIVLLGLYLLLSRSFITSAKMIESIGVVALLIVFEFLNLLLHPFLEKVTHHSPVLMLLALVGIAALLVPLHHKAEKWATTKLIEKNKEIRLAAARRTIEELDVKPSNV